MATDQSIHTTDHTNGPIHYKQATQTSPLKETSKAEGNKQTSGGGWLRAYGATLVTMGTVVHLVASVVTAILYFLFSSPSGESAYPIWYAPVFGALSTYAVFLLIAALSCKSIATVETANRRCYGLLQTRLRQLKARIETVEQHVPPMHLRREEYRQIALKEARSCYDYIDEYLRKHPTGMQWVTGAGYSNVWGAIHRAEEALIEIEPPEMVLRGALHDKLALQNSTIGNREELLDKLVHAVTDIEPAGALYLRERQPEQHSEVLYQLVEAMNQFDEVEPKIVWNTGEIRKGQDIYEAVGHTNARMVISEVRRTLNEFRDGLWEGLVRERNQLLTAMSITALMTYILLCIAIIMGRPNTSILLGATAFYMVGAVSGLFGRFYKESKSNKSSGGIDDYGLAQARLIATPILSGLAGVGGVLITIILYTTLLMPAINNSAAAHNSNIVQANQSVQITLEDVFRPDEPSYLLTAAVFGLAPNLIIGGLQLRTQRYAYELRRSKSGERDERAG
jgi:hypothetical protein